MATIDQFSNYAETALAAYAALIVTSQNVQAYRDVGMGLVEAQTFNAQWAVVSQSPSDASGFSAVLLQSTQTNEKVLAIRGTEGSLGGADYITDFLDIGAGQLRTMPQYAALEGFYQQLISTGKLGSSEKIIVTGHSLGGFLA